MSGTSRPRFGKPPGSTVVLRVRWTGAGRPHEDDIFRSSGGSLYFVEEARRAGKRWKLTCLKLDPDSFKGEPDWHLEWDRRG